MRSIVIACVKSWNINYTKIFKEKNSQYKVDIITNPQNLKLKRLENINPEYIFFPYWSWKITPEIYEKYQCIGFHITDLPYGRGGSPL